MYWNKIKQGLKEVAETMSTTTENGHDPAIQRNLRKSTGDASRKPVPAKTIVKPKRQSEPVIKAQKSNDSFSTNSSKTDHYTKWVKHRVSCSNCSKLFDEPQTLSCLHSLCTRCIKALKVEVRGTTPGFVCPRCEEFCEKDAVRTNFLLTELLNFYLMMTQRGTITTCKQCHKPEPKHRCLDCKADFCSSCRKVHDGFELMRVSHRWISHADIGKKIVIDKLMFCEHHPKHLVKHNCMQCDKIVCESCLSSTHADHENETIDHAVKRITPELKNHQATLESSIEVADKAQNEIKQRTAEICTSIENQAEEARRIHRKQTEKLNTDLIHLLSQFEELKSEAKQKGQKMVADYQQEARKTQKAAAMVETTMRIAQGTSLIQELQCGMFDRVRGMAEENRIERLPKANTIRNVQPILIPQVVEISEYNTIGHIVSRNPSQAINMSDVWSFALKDIAAKSPTLVSTMQLGEGKFARHFHHQNNELWIPVTEDNQARLRVFSFSGEALKDIALPLKVQQPNAIVQTRRALTTLSDTEFAVIACDSGLFTITPKGHIIQTLSESSFSDLCLSGGTIYALEYKKQQVMTYDFTDKGWEARKVLDIKNAESGAHDTIHVCGNNIHVACWWADTITSYSMTGEKLSQYKEKKPAKNNKSSAAAIVKIANPRLSGSDPTGALLFCDSGNRRIQILSADGKYGSTVLQGLHVDPVHIIPKDYHSFLVLGISNTLLHFSFE